MKRMQHQARPDAALREVIEAAMSADMERGAAMAAALPPGPPPLRIGPDEMAAALGIARRTLRDYQRRRIVPFERIGPARGRSKVFYDRAAVDEALCRWRTRTVGDVGRLPPAVAR